MNETTPPPAAHDTGGALTALRAELARRALDAFIIPHSDEHQGEYLPPSAERLARLSGFTGSAGSAVVTTAAAAIFVDGRYTLQVGDQVDSALFQIHHLTRSPPMDWIAGNLRPGDVLGYDPRLHTTAQVAALDKACRKAGARLAPQDGNPIDAVWRDRPSPPMTPMRPYPVRYAGRESADKRARIAQTLRAAKQDAVVLGASDSIAWLLNVRGGDLPYMPVTLAFAILYDDGKVDLFIDRRKTSDALIAHLGDAVRVLAPEDFAAALGALGEGAKTVRTPHGVNAWIVETLRAAGARPDPGDDPCQLPKAIKNDVELAGMRAAHVRDGAALTRFLAWIKTAAAAGGIDEISAADTLEGFRRENDAFEGLSFPTISGAGPNGAIVHYTADPRSNRALETGSLYLVDSGGQYLDGTTDVTRTLAIGAPNAAMRTHFTLVLKGHIALARAVFPKGTTGAQLDAFARRPLWEAGLDYDHGTGHGVGCFLGVHEGPQRISKSPGTVALEPGMVLSNEPGYYAPDAYGIRIENLVAVARHSGFDHPGGPGDHDGLQMLCFDTLTLAPIDRDLIDLTLLNGDEVAWIDAYHHRVYDTLAPRLDADCRAWLARACAVLGATDDARRRQRP
ncbi:aminopeptidase P family protein [Varunaivibrio sulfuroxidans]|uniref:Xaa-Pro aminopeptidase n=1 Tax=Varunaivibrio sulfuroxidans TaxID=1773489 RepID=A0A4R3JCP7_9PROT|nr:aminopeptidase P family protein [Varunaivibrio sulfuroxidans]TCS63532.1 Xaa-Pro aminopeptidase [Varunaivibrio sulfuroxidans]WES30324.1 aminopeptidase family protein P [Varunaivibrio sulfuroxidans]